IPRKKPVDWRIVPHHERLASTKYWALPFQHSAPRNKSPGLATGAGESWITTHRTRSRFLVSLRLSRARGWCKCAEARASAFFPRLARIRAPLGPREQSCQFLALALLAVDELGKRQRLAVKPAPLDLAGLAVDRFPDERGRRLITLHGLVG